MDIKRISWITENWHCGKLGLWNLILKYVDTLISTTSETFLTIYIQVCSKSKCYDYENVFDV